MIHFTTNMCTPFLKSYFQTLFYEMDSFQHAFCETHVNWDFCQYSKNDSFLSTPYSNLVKYANCQPPLTK